MYLAYIDLLSRFRPAIPAMLSGVAAMLGLQVWLENPRLLAGRHYSSASDALGDHWFNAVVIVTALARGALIPAHDTHTKGGEVLGYDLVGVGWETCYAEADESPGSGRSDLCRETSAMRRRY
jgi:hypothetical protein